MNGAHLHLILNHAPLFGVLIGLGLLLVALFRNSDGLKQAASFFSSSLLWSLSQPT